MMLRINPGVTLRSRPLYSYDFEAILVSVCLFFPVFRIYGNLVGRSFSLNHILMAFHCFAPLPLHLIYRCMIVIQCCSRGSGMGKQNMQIWNQILYSTCVFNQFAALEINTLPKWSANRDSRMNDNQHSIGSEPLPFQSMVVFPIQQLLFHFTSVVKQEMKHTKHRSSLQMQHNAWTSSRNFVYLFVTWQQFPLPK